MACLQVKLCVAISERFRKRIWYLRALYECSGLLTLLAVLYAYALNIRRAVKIWTICLAVFARLTSVTNGRTENIMTAYMYTSLPITPTSPAEN